MGSSIDSSRPAIRESTNGGAPVRELLMDGPSRGGLCAFEELDNALAKSEKLTLLPAVADEQGEFRVVVDPEYLPRPPAPQAPVPQAPAPSRLDALYADDFRRLELALEASHPHVPMSVTEGNLATLSLVGVSHEGDAVFKSGLEVHVAGPAK